MFVCWWLMMVDDDRQWLMMMDDDIIYHIIYRLNTSIIIVHVVSRFWVLRCFCVAPPALKGNLKSKHSKHCRFCTLFLYQKSVPCVSVSYTSHAKGLHYKIFHGAKHQKAATRILLAKDGTMAKALEIQLLWSFLFSKNSHISTKTSASCKHHFHISNVSHKKQLLC